ncbi:MAG: flagellar basal body P-ring protein FlgI [Candidatus Brocadiia bacterium]|nr:MAG: flagellar basal body P-ring protein FlgI [Candidatus Brocadiia bacterium]
MKARLIVSFAVFLSFFQTGQCQRIKDITDIHGIRSNPLRGVGLVIGLSNTGDKSIPSQQMLTNILRASGQVLSPSALAQGNIAMVMVTAELGPFAREGSRLDVDVSSIGDAVSLQGGRLLATELKGLDGQVYAIADGSISLGGWTVSGKQASITKNHQTVGRIPGGGIVEKAEIASFVEYIADNRFVTLNLRNNDFSTAERISAAINQIFPQSALTLDAGTIKIMIPSYIPEQGISGFIVKITEPEVKVDIPAVVVINERTGTIVVGERVAISPAAAICQGSLVVKIKETANVSQPNASFSDAGSTEVTPETLIGVAEPAGILFELHETVSVSDLAKTLNAIGASPTDLIAIFNALKQAGALQARLEIM